MGITGRTIASAVDLTSFGSATNFAPQLPNEFVMPLKDRS